LPFLNPIELFWSKVKTGVKRKEQREIVSVWMIIWVLKSLKLQVKWVLRIVRAASGIPFHFSIDFWPLSQCFSSSNGLQYNKTYPSDKSAIFFDAIFY
jgi:hypothetical protein